MSSDETAAVDAGSPSGPSTARPQPVPIAGIPEGRLPPNIRIIRGGGGGRLPRDGQGQGVHIAQAHRPPMIIRGGAPPMGGRVPQPRQRRPPHRQQPPVAVLQLPPLRPEVLAEQEYKSVVNEEDLPERFKCAICMDILKEAAGCGRCSGRFCLSCLVQVMKQTGSENAPRGNCPTCRSTLTGTLLIDRELNGDMKTVKDVPCRLRDCAHVNATLGDYHSHEIVCPHVRVKCRFASYGCPWQGLRNDEPTHEACAYRPLSSFLHDQRVQRVMTEENFRRVKYDFEELASNVSRRASRSLQHPVQVMEYAILLLWSKQLLLQQSNWEEFRGSPACRARVCIRVALAPTMVLAWKSLSLATRRLAEHKVPTYEALAFVCALATLVLYACAWDPGRTPIWRPVSTPGGFVSSRQLPVLGPIAMLLLHFTWTSVLQWYESLTVRVITWLLIVWTSVMFPKLIVARSMALAMDRPPTREQSAPEWPSADVLDDLQLAARFCLIHAVLGAWYALDVAMLQLPFLSIKQRKVPHRWYLFCAYWSMRLANLVRCKSEEEVGIWECLFSEEWAVALLEDDSIVTVTCLAGLALGTASLFAVLDEGVKRLGQFSEQESEGLLGKVLAVVWCSSLFWLCGLPST